MAKKESTSTPKAAVSRKTNEEIDTDEQGNLIIHGEKIPEAGGTSGRSHSDGGNAQGIED